MGLPTCRHKGCNNEVREKFDKRDGKMRYTSDCNTCESLMRKYKINTPQRDAMMEAQDNECLICNSKLEGFAQGRGLSQQHGTVDHCHITGKVRAILCGSCNNLMGRSYDQIYVLENALQYLTHFRAEFGLDSMSGTDDDGGSGDR